MGGDSAENIETAVDRLAAVIFAAAAAFAVWRLSPSATWALPGSAAVVAFLVVRAVLRRLHANRPQFRLPEFELASFEAVELPELLLTELPELVLTDQDRVPVVKAHKGEELLLDDILAEMGPGSRVVRLFDPSAMPTPGQLNARIEQHLDHASTPAAAPDASKALYDALAELRRSLR